MRGEGEGGRGGSQWVYSQEKETVLDGMRETLTTTNALSAYKVNVGVSVIEREESADADAPLPSTCSLQRATPEIVLCKH